MVQFNIDSRHVEDARFKKVLFGYDGDLLEVELNELQDIFNSRLNRLVDEVFGSRPVYTGTYGLSSGTLTITNELVAINRELIFIPSATLTVASGDTVYLNYQDKSITTSDTVKQYGNLLGAGTISNYLQDSRLGKETTRRVQASYQLTKTNVGTGTFLKLCTISGSTVVKNTADYPDSDLYKEIRRLADAQISASSFASSLTAHIGAGGSAHANAVAGGAAGFMTGADKTKLDSVATGAEVNQNTFGSVTAGGVTVSSASKTGTLAFTAGTGVTLTGDNTGKAVTIGMSAATQSAQGAMSAADKTKLDGVATGAEVNQNTFGTVTAGGVSVASASKTGTLALNAGTGVTLTGDNTGKAVTIGMSAATQSAQGAMSSADKTKLDGIATGAEVNQNAFTTVTAGGVTMAADTKSDTLALVAGNAVTLTGDATTDTVTIAVPNATTSVAGALSAADKQKLDSVAVGASGAQFVFQNVTVGGNTLVADTVSDTLTINAGNAVTLTSDATTDTFTIAVPNATTSVAGALSATDKTKLDGIATGAEVNQNAFSTVTAGGTALAADAKSDTLTVTAGTGITVTGDATTDTMTIAVDSTIETKTGAQSKADAVQTNLTAHIGTGGSAHANVVAGGASGFMTGADKTKLDGVATGAEVNQNTFSTVKVGATNVAADAKSDTLEFVAGTGVVLTPDATNDKVTFAVDSTIETTTGSQSKADAALASAKTWAQGYGIGTLAKLLANATDLNTLAAEEGFYRGTGLTNAPGTGYYYIIQLAHSATYITQVAYAYGSGSTGAGKEYRRQMNSGTWSAWEEQETVAGAQAKADAVAARKVLTSTGLTGGGDLTADRTFSFDTTWGDGRYARLDGSNAYTGNITVGRTGGQLLTLKQTDWTASAGAAGSYNYIGFADSTGAWQSYVGYPSGSAGVFAINNKLGDINVVPTGGNLTVNGTPVVLNTRSISAGSGLTGGGTLAADRTLSVSFGGNGSAATVSRSDHSHTIAGTSITDVAITSVADNELLAYDSASSKWINKTLSEVGVATVASPTFTGTVTAPIMRLTTTADVSLTSTGHAFQIGADNTYNLIIDANEIMARNNGAASSLILNADGGSVTINGSIAWHQGNLAFAGTGSATTMAKSDHDHDGTYAKLAGDTFTGNLRMASAADTASQQSRVIYFDATDASAVKTTNNYLRVNTNNDLIYYKAGSGGTVWTAANDGSGSTMDADMVDGAHAGTAANNVLKLSSLGIANIPAQPGFNVIMGSSTSVAIPANTDTLLSFNSTVKGAHRDGDLVNGVYTAPDAGVYIISATAFCNVVPAGTTSELRLYKNGTKVQTIARQVNAGTGNISYQLQGMTMIELASGDTLKVYISSGFAHNIDATNSFVNIAKLS